jgi:hypothetical protein
MNLEDFASEADPKHTLPERFWILLFAYFLRKHKSQTSFIQQELLECFDAGLVKRPENSEELLTKLLKGKLPPLIRVKDEKSFSLSRDGLVEVEDYLATVTGKHGLPENLRTTVLPYLRKIALRVTDENKRRFLAEAISCLGAEATRASIVMVWILTIDHLYDYVLKHKLIEFNNALQAKGGKYSRIVIKEKDDFEELKESEFIEVLRGSGAITNDVRKILDEKLGVRNSSAHPSGITIHPTKVINFVEDLVDNVVVKYVI